MKRYLKISFLVVLAISFVACTPEDDIFEESFLYGTWLNQDRNNKEEYYTYFDNGKGYTWDEADDVTEDEAQPFTWTLEGSNLIHIHIMADGKGDVPKPYTLMILTSTTMKYKDFINKEFTFTKVR